MTEDWSLPSEWKTGTEDLIVQLKRLELNRRNGSTPDDPVILLESQCESLDVLKWLSRQKASIKFYWKDRDNRYEVAGLDAVDAISGKDCPLPRGLSERARSLLNPYDKDTTYFGGLRFDPQYPSAHRTSVWKDFGDGMFVLPRIQLERFGNRCTLSCRLLSDELSTETIAKSIAGIRGLKPEETSEESVEPGAYQRQDNPDREEWQRNIDAALKMFDEGLTRKIVLARETVLNFKRDLNPWQLLESLRRSSESTFLFGFQPVEGTAFIGASPERLYRRRWQEIETEAIAGTRPRGSDEDEDLRLIEELLLSAKDRREHDLVAECIVNDMGKLCREIDSDPLAGILKQSRVQHLLKKITGTLESGVSDSDVLNTLHPTPAVGGSPRKAAVEAIKTLEAFDRGWYAGPIGWLSIGAAELAVGIRSGLVQGRSLHLYSGAGIVPGSTVEEEWQEVEQKMSGFLEAVTDTQV